jgi:magnesium-protoporphyrin O-methyltransferase
MDCCQCKGIESLFNEREAQRELAAYRKSGPSRTTRMLIDALKAQDSEATTLLDIGGGIGAIQHELLRDGVESATSVDASTAYVRAAREEAERRGHADKVRYLHANFVEVAPELPQADIVTLDRVICCYHDMPSLVGLSAARAARLYGLVYPRDTWWLRAGARLANLYFRLARNPYRAFVHRTQAVDALVRDYGLRQSFYKHTALWQVAVYAR